jgi:purine-cytosine permease-like protein
MTTVSDPAVEVREGTYGDKVIAVEPGGAEFIPLSERHGRPLQLFWTWTSPNMEFATVFVGFIGVVFFGLSFWATFLAILIGTTLGAAASATGATSCPPGSTPWSPASAGSR